MDRGEFSLSTVQVLWSFKTIVNSGPQLGEQMGHSHLPRPSGIQTTLHTYYYMWSWTDPSAASKASQLVAAIQMPAFCIALCVCARFARLLLPISKILQDPKMDLVQCVNEIQGIVCVLQNCREDCDEDFKRIFENTQELCSGTICIPRRAGRQTMRPNYSTDDPEVFYRQAIYLPYLDGLLVDIKSRFSKHVELAARLQHLLPKYVVCAEYKDIRPCLELYKEDVAVGNVEDEFRRWKLKWKEQKQDSLPKNAIETLSCIKNHDEFYPNIYILIKIFATLPVTTTTAERSFSCLRRLKTYLRASMGEERLSGLALMNIHRTEVPSPESVLDELAKSSRRINLAL